LADAFGTGNAARSASSLAERAAPVSFGWRARLTRHEHKLGEWERARRVPDVRLTGVLSRELLGYQHSRAQFGAWLEPPRPELTLMIDLDGSLSADGRALPDAWIGGLDDRPTIVGFGETYGSLDLKLTPLGAYRLVGLPLSELTGACLPLSDVFGRVGAELAERVRNTADGAARVEALAAEIGCSRRYLSEAFRRQVGLPPKTAGRLMRFQHVRRRIEHSPAHWSDVAYAAGYADQSHLNREFRELAGTTPGDFVRRLIPGGGIVGDRSH
jgi:AraC-like DNA-binding protein